MNAKIDGTPIDFIFKGGHAWGEVIYASKVLNGSDIPLEKMKQALLLSASLKKLNDTNHELHYFFPNGIYAQAAKEFQELGLHVHGIISPTL